MLKIMVSKIKYISLVIVFAIVTALIGFTFIGCNYENKLEDAVSIARRDFGCKKVLWVGRARNKNIFYADMSKEDGYYVIGTDKNGDEVYVAVPAYEYKDLKPTTFEWPLDYTFAQIIEVFSERGYEYGDGIDGHERAYYKYYNEHQEERITIIDREEQVKQHLSNFGDSDELYEKLDVKLLIRFFNFSEDERIFYFLVQEGGALKLYTIVDDYLNGFTEEIVRNGNE